MTKIEDGTKIKTKENTYIVYTSIRDDKVKTFNVFIFNSDESLTPLRGNIRNEHDVMGYIKGYEKPWRKS